MIKSPKKGIPENTEQWPCTVQSQDLFSKNIFFSFYTQIDEIQDYFWKNLIGSIYGMISWTQEQTVLHIPRYTNEAKMKIKPLEFVSVR